MAKATIIITEDGDTGVRISAEFDPPIKTKGGTVSVVENAAAIMLNALNSHSSSMTDVEVE